MTPLEIKTLRLSYNQTQAEFAEIIGVERRTVMRWELGRNKPYQFYLGKLDNLRRKL